MGIMKSFVFLLLMVFAINASSHRHHHHHHGYYPEHRQEDSHVDFVERETDVGSKNVADAVQTESSETNKKHSENLNNVEALPFSPRRLERMLEKAILRIITGDLGAAEMLMLKSLNYTPEQVHVIRQREFERKRKDEELRKRVESGKRFYNENLYGNKANNWNSMEVPDSTSRNDDDNSANEKRKNQYNDKDFDFDKYNRQAVIDYEDRASKYNPQHSWSETNFDYEDESRNSGERDSMEPHVIFKIPYDDSEFDSSSDERSSKVEPKHRTPSTLRQTTAKNVANSFHASSLSSSSSSSSSSASSAATGHPPLPVVYQLGKDSRSNYARKGRSFSTTPEPETPEPVDIANAMSSTTENTVSKKTSEYEGLEWVEDDVYRVIPEFEDLQIYADENETSDYEGQNPDGNDTDTSGYQNDDPDSLKLYGMNASNENASQANLSAYQQTIIAHHREENVTSSFDSQGQKAIEDIKTKILVITGRLNHSTNTNQVQRERLTMFLPTCQIPRNTDSEAWTDQFSMNMHFQLNLTSVDHIAAAKLRIYKLPQDNITSSTDEDEVDEKKIRISVYYYTKALKKHRPKKRLMDSVVTPLTAQGTHLALDVRQGLRFWQLNSQDSQGNSNNHGLVIQIEDQDGRPLKTAEYIQQPSCENRDSDQKSNACLHFSSEPALLTFAS